MYKKVVFIIKFNVVIKEKVVNLIYLQASIRATWWVFRMFPLFSECEYECDRAFVGNFVLSFMPIINGLVNIWRFWIPYCDSLIFDFSRSCTPTRVDCFVNPLPVFFIGVYSNYPCVSFEVAFFKLRKILCRCLYFHFKND